MIFKKPKYYNIEAFSPKVCSWTNFIEDITRNKQLDYLRLETPGTAKYPLRNSQSKEEVRLCIVVLLSF